MSEHIRELSTQELELCDRWMGHELGGSQPAADTSRIHRGPLLYARMPWPHHSSAQSVLVRLSSRPASANWRVGPLF